jgi:predicted nucleic acid-binding protein
MRHLLDTCVVSELVAKQPNERVVRWVDELDPIDTYLSAITIGEIQKGITKLPDSRRKTALVEWLRDELLVRFDGHILPVDTEVMLKWGRFTGALELEGKTMPAIDSLIAAIALHRNLRLVTRNEDDFKHAGVLIVNPWRA